jgi:DNA-binding response OmpR family regulator
MSREQTPVAKILIVDDDRATSTLLRTLFEIEGFVGIVCPKPEDVLNTARREKPDVVLMDCIWPKSIRYIFCGRFASMLNCRPCRW